jgi:anti-anti-sigma factor
MNPADEDQSHAGDSILLGEDSRGIFFQARGHVRAMNCFPLREEVLPRLEGGGSPVAVYVDLSACRYMDSTFIGLLVAMDGRLKKNACGHLHIVNPSPECLDSLSRLGLEKVLSMEKGAVDFPPDMRPVQTGGKPGAEFILKAHEALMESSEEARKKFSLLKEVLQKKLKKE